MDAVPGSESRINRTNLADIQEEKLITGEQLDGFI